MNCRTARRTLVDYVEGELGAAEQAEITAHLARCVACRAEAAALQQAENALRRLSVIEPAPAATATSRRHPAPRLGRRIRWVWAGVGLATAAVLLAVLVWPHAKTRPASPSANVAMKAEPAELPAPDEAEVVAPAEPPAPPAPVVEEQPRAPRRVVRRPKPAPSVALETPPPVPVPAERPLPEPVAADGRDDAPAGIILLIGEARNSAPASSYYAEMSFPDGAKSVVQQTVERDADNQPRAVRVAYERTGPEAPSPDQGG
ncbi:MAG: zf-HC2 domain-containing protein [Armatimonadota bacterium]|nr:MAG: zf-HC2 domain-containing protein [Armatimonadota bacterium]